MITVNNKQFRNLEEQVQKNKEDIARHYEIDRVVADWGIKVLGVVETVDAIPAAEYEYGDAYGLSSTDPMQYVVWTRANPGIGQDSDYWLNVGALSLIGPQGPEGEQGERGETGVRGSKWYQGNSIPSTAIGGSLPGDYYLNNTNGDVYYYVSPSSGWSLVGNIRGPQGLQGLTGQQGQIGPQGPAGPQGPKGDSGQSFQIAGFIASTDLLPAPTESTRNQAYAVGAEGDYDMYVIAPDEGGTLVWVNMGKISGVEGPQGPAGPTGAGGVGAIRVPIDTDENPISEDKLNTIINSDAPIIELGDEFFYPADDWEETVVFSHVGQLEGQTYCKTLSLDKATGSWIIVTNTFSKAPVELKYDSSQNYSKVFNDLIAGTVDYPITIDGEPVWLAGFKYVDGSWQEAHLWVINRNSRPYKNFTSLGKNNNYDYISIWDYTLHNYATKLSNRGARYMPVSPYNTQPPFGEYTTTTRIEDDNGKTSNVRFNFYYSHSSVGDSARTIGFFNQDSANKSGYDTAKGNATFDKGYLGYVTAYQYGDGSGSQYYYKVVTPGEVTEMVSDRPTTTAVQTMIDTALEDFTPGGGGEGENNFDFVTVLPEDTEAKTGDLVYVRTSDNTMWRFEYDMDRPQGQWINPNYGIPAETKVTLCLNSIGQTFSEAMINLVSAAFDYYADAEWSTYDSDLNGVPITVSNIYKETGPWVKYAQLYRDKYQTLVDGGLEASIEAPDYRPLCTVHLRKNEPYYDYATEQWRAAYVGEISFLYYKGEWQGVGVGQAYSFDQGGTWHWNTYQIGNDTVLGTNWNDDNLYIQIKSIGGSPDGLLNYAFLWYNGSWFQLDEPELPARAEFPQIYAPIIRQGRSSFPVPESYIQTHTLNAEPENFNHAIIINGGAYQGEAGDQSSFHEYGRTFNFWGDSSVYLSYKPGTGVGNRATQLQTLLDTVAKSHPNDNQNYRDKLVLSVNDYGLVHKENAYLYPTQNGTLAVESSMPNPDGSWAHPTALQRLNNLKSWQKRRLALTPWSNGITDIYYGYILDQDLTTIALTTPMVLNQIDGHEILDVYFIKRVDDGSYLLKGYGHGTTGTVTYTTVTINNSDNLIKISALI